MNKDADFRNRSQRVKLGNSKGASTAKRDLFVKAFLANGQNATQAAITAGYSRKSAKQAGSRMLTYVDVSAAISTHRAATSVTAGLHLDKTLREVARIAYFDIRRLYDSKTGQIKGVTELDQDITAAISSFEIYETITDGKVTVRITKIKLWDKNAALDKAMRYAGAYTMDNAQRSLPPAVVNPPGKRTVPPFKPFDGRKRGREPK